MKKAGSWLVASMVVAAALLAGLHHVPSPDEALVVAEGTFGGEARLLEPGIGWSVPILTRTYRYDSRPFPFDRRLSRSAGDAYPASREGAAVRLNYTLKLRLDPSTILDLHRDAGRAYKDPGRLGPILDEAARSVARDLPYDELVALEGPTRERIGGKLAAAAGEAGFLLEEVEDLVVWPEPYPEDVDPDEGGERILLVGLDGADWKILDRLFDEGGMPRLEALVRGGARARLRTITPVLSPIIWTSVATGKGPEKHGIMDFLAVDSRTGKQIPVTSTMRTARAFWQILSGRGITTGTVGWWATWPAERVLGFQVTDRVAYQLFGAQEEGTGLRGRTYPEALILSLRPTIDEARGAGEKDLESLLGRPADPNFPDEAALQQILRSTRIYHGSALRLLREYRPRVAAVYYEGTDTVAHLFMRYAAPRMPGVSREEFERWGSVVEGYYRLQDRLLGELLDAAGPGTNVIVVSDHGFKSGSTRPQTDSRIGVGVASDWHRRFGIFAASGPAFVEGEVLEDLSVLDVTPTMFRLLGLPQAEDFDGRPAAGLLKATGRGSGTPPAIATYEGEDWREPAPDLSDDPAAAEVASEMIAKLTALGYLGQTTPNASNNSGITMLQQGRLAEAEKAFRAALEQEPGFHAARVNLARVLMAGEDWQAALKELKAVQEVQPDALELENLIGNVYMQMDRLPQAEETFLAALEKDPRNPNLWNSLGIVRSRMGKLQEALRDYRKVVEIDEEYAEAINNIGLIQRELGDQEAARRAFREAIQADPEFPGSYNNLGLSFQDTGRQEEALQAYERGLEVDPENAIILNNKGSALLALERTEEARDAFRAAVESDPGYAAAHNNLGAALGLLGDLTGEFEEYLKAIELDGGYVDARLNLALNLKKRGLRREQEKSLVNLIEISPEHPGAHLEMGILKAGEGEIDEAVRHLEIAAGAAPRWPMPRNVLAQIYQARGRPEAAVRELRASLEMNPDQPEMRKLLDELERGITTGSK